MNVGSSEDATAADWLEKAEEDLHAAAVLLENRLPEASSFHAQQAAEKALKAVEIGRRGVLEKTHDLLRLSRRLKAGATIDEHAAVLSEFYSVARYPDAGGEVSREDAEDALHRAKEVVSWARTQTS